MDKYAIHLTHEKDGDVIHRGDPEMTHYGPFEHGLAVSALSIRGWEREVPENDSSWVLKIEPSRAIYARIVPAGNRISWADKFDLPRKT